LEKSTINILVQNEQLIAVDKPAGLSVHNLEDETNLLQVLEKQIGSKKLFPVHRLDKETSGVQLLAFSSGAARDISEEFQKRSVKKIYIGVLRGQYHGSALTKNQGQGRNEDLVNGKLVGKGSDIQVGAWSYPLTDKAEGRKNPQGLAAQRIACETIYQVVRSNKYFTLLEFDLQTGRQHQIRKHALLSGHALIGDARYGDPKFNEKISNIYGTGRMFLHCARIEIRGQVISANIPIEFSKLFERQPAPTK
jgi:23S rRNA-/tRNA-specific pseudouridylate synthase